MKVKVLTLNCWGLPAPIAQFHHERIAAISKELSKGEFDIVLLQEIWSQADYEKLCLRILPVLPHAHYFHSGMFGSGACIFSRFQILETFQHNYSLNGYAHKVFHGDWFASKAVGLAKLLCEDMRINVYVTHTHADYCEIKDEYRAHRVVQAYELSQFVKMTSESCDAVILGGDFNFKPTDLGYKMVIANANLVDSWIAKKDKSGDDVGATSCNPENTFSPVQGRKLFPKGKRIDYILFRNNGGCDVSCDHCWVTMRHVPDQTFSFSDHEGVAAQFNIRRNITAMAPPRCTEDIETYYKEAVPYIEAGLKRMSWDQMYYTAAMVLCIMTVILTAEVHIPFGLGLLLVLTRFLLTLCIGFCFWMGLVMSRREYNGLMAAKKDIGNLLKSNSLS